jgi:hypothetical protein
MFTLKTLLLLLLLLSLGLIVFEILSARKILHNPITKQNRKEDTLTYLLRT